jgi:hypothetical protein
MGQAASQDPESTAVPQPTPTPAPSPSPEPNPGGGLAGQVVSGDSLGLLPADVKPIVLPQQPLKLVGTGLVPIRLRCVQLPEANCRGTVVITAPLMAFSPRGGKGKLVSSRRRKVKMVRIARGKVTIPSGEAATAKLRLSGAAKRALAQRGSLRVEVTASMEVGGEIRASRRTFTLRAPKAKKKRR